MTTLEKDVYYGIASKDYSAVLDLCKKKLDGKEAFRVTIHDDTRMTITGDAYGCRIEGPQSAKLRVLDDGKASVTDSRAPAFILYFLTKEAQNGELGMEFKDKMMEKMARETITETVVQNGGKLQIQPFGIALRFDDLMKKEFGITCIGESGF